jgi:hypothetical protein
MTMKIFYACWMVLLFTTIPVYAQDQPQGDEKHQPPSTEDIVAKMQSKLSLTQDQANAVMPIVEKYSSKRQEIRQSMQDGTADKDSIRSQMKQLKEDEKQELSQVLSEDQLGQWEQMQNQGRHKHGSGGNGESKGESNAEGNSETGG